MTGKWYSKSIRQAETELRTDINRGLNRREVKARRQKRGENDIFSLPRQSYRSYLGHLLSDIPTIMFLLTIAIAVVFEERSSLAIALVILAVYVFGAVTSYVRAQRVLERMGHHALPCAKVMREGKLYLIKQKQLVQGDIIFLSGGDIVPCDARLVEAEALEALETNLTSATRTVNKSAEFVGWGDLPPSHQRNMVFASTILTSGKAKAIVCEVGADTLVCKMEKNKPIVTHENLKIFTTLRQISRIWSVCMMVMIFLISGAALIFGVGSGNLFDTFLTALSLAVSSMSEYYMPFGFLIVACGIYSAVKKYRDISSGAMIKDIGKLDVLRKVDCLLVPMDGIFTACDHRVETVYANGDEYDTAHVGFSKNCTQAVRYALLSTGLYGADALGKNNITGNNVYTPEEEAIIRAAEDLKIYHADLEVDYSLLEHRGLDSMNHLETSIVRSRGANLLAIRGGVQEILSRCKTYCEEGRILPLDAKKRSELMIAAMSMAKRSYRVIAVASGTTEYEKVVKPSLLQKDLTFEGFLGIREPILPGVALHIQKCKEAGISVLMMTDDEDENHISFAKTLGIIDGDDEVMTGSAAGRMKEAIFRVNAEKDKLYMGLNIAQKRLLVKSLQDRGKVVGVLAHTLEEIVLYREADIGFSQSVTISEGAGRRGVDMTSRRIPVFNRDGKNQVRGCEALKFVSDVIISEASAKGEGGFNAMIQSLICAKSIFLGLHHALRYLLTTQTARMGMALFSIASGIELLTPVQIVYTGLIVDFLAVLVIAFMMRDQSVLSRPMPTEEQEKTVKGLLFSNAFSFLVGVLWAVCGAALPLIYQRAGLVLTSSEITTMLFYAFVISQPIVFLCSGQHKIFTGRIRINRMTLLALLISIGVPILCATVASIGVYFDCVPIPLPALIGIAALPAIVLSAYLTDRGIKKTSKKKQPNLGGIYEREDD